MPMVMSKDSSATGMDCSSLWSAKSQLNMQSIQHVKYGQLKMQGIQDLEYGQLNGQLKIRGSEDVRLTR